MLNSLRLDARTTNCWRLTSIWSTPRESNSAKAVYKTAASTSRPGVDILMVRVIRTGNGADNWDRTNIIHLRYHILEGWAGMSASRGFHLSTARLAGLPATTISMNKHSKLAKLPAHRMRIQLMPFAHTFREGHPASGVVSRKRLELL